MSLGEAHVCLLSVLGTVRLCVLPRACPSRTARDFSMTDPNTSGEDQAAGYDKEDDSVVGLEDVEQPLATSAPWWRRSCGWFVAQLRAWGSTLVVLYVLLMSEAVRGITVPTQADYVRSVRAFQSAL